MIRPATTADAAACAEIYAPYVTDTVISFEAEPPTASEMRRRMGEAHLWLVAEERGEIAGYAYGSPHRERDAYRWAVDVAIYLRDEHRGRGLGRALYARLIDGLRQRGAHVLCAGVALPNEASERLHRGVGFAEVGTYRRIAFKLGGWIDTRWYQLDLEPPPGSASPSGAGLPLPHERADKAFGEALDGIMRHSSSRAVACARVADAIRARTAWRWVGIYTVAEGLVINEAWSGPAPPAHSTFPVTQGLTGAALLSGDAVICDDVAADPRYLANQQSTGSEMIVPITRAGRIVGTLDAESDCRLAFGPRDLRKGEDLAQRLARLWSG